MRRRFWPNSPPSRPLPTPTRKRITPPPLGSPPPRPTTSRPSWGFGGGSLCRPATTARVPCCWPARALSWPIISRTHSPSSTSARVPRRPPPPAPPPARRGEFYFNDASICFQGWQSCASCHSSDARVDGLNWDNLNDGMGNPKNAKSLLFAHQTPPSMWLGVRSNATVAVRAGIRNSLFTVQPAEVADAIDAYLKSLKPIPSPRLVPGRLSPGAERGRKLFSSEAVGCADCHKGALFKDLKLHT